MKKYFDGEKLKELRKSRKKTGQEIANKINISQGYYTKFENGHTVPDADILGAILEALDTDLSNFFLDRKKEKDHSPDVYDFIHIYNQLTATEQKTLMSFLKMFVSKG